jgi:DNA-binding Lrp family transcriptional regulator
MNDQQHVATSERDRKVLQLIQATVSMSAADIGKALKLKPHIARRSIERLREQQAVHPYVPINTCALGFTEYQIVLDWGGNLGTQASALVQKIMEHDHVPFVSELAGKLQFAVWARDAAHLGALLDDIIGVLPSGVSKTVILRRWFHAFVVTFDGLSSFQGYRLAPNPMTVSIDETDHRILKAICQLNQFSSQQIGRAAGIPGSTVDYRIRRLVKENVLLEPRYYINESKFGFHRLNVRLRAESPSTIRESLLAAARQSGESSSLAEVIGPWDFELSLALRSDLTTNTILSRILQQTRGKVSVVEILPLIRYLKISNYPFVRFR